MIPKKNYRKILKETQKQITENPLLNACGFCMLSDTFMNKFIFNCCGKTKQDLAKEFDLGDYTNCAKSAAIINILCGTKIPITGSGLFHKKSMGCSGHDIQQELDIRKVNFGTREVVKV